MCQPDQVRRMRFLEIARLSGLLIAVSVQPGRGTDLIPHQVSANAVNEQSSVPIAQQSLLSPKSVATDPDWGVLVFAGASAGRSNLLALIPAPWAGDYADNYFVGAALERRLGRIYQHFTFELEGGAGYRFKEVNAPEIWGGLFLRFDGFPWSHIIFTTIAIDTGLSYVGSVSAVEKAAGADVGHPDGSRLLHYLGPEITFANPKNRNTELVIRWHHRSGVYGLFNGIHGASNVVTGGIRLRF